MNIILPVKKLQTDKMSFKKKTSGKVVFSLQFPFISEFEKY